MKKSIVVFDIDDAICMIGNSYELEAIKAANPECPIVMYKCEKSEQYPHLFVPYLQVLFEYLIKNGARVVFFSSAVEHRNISVIPQLLVNILGEERYALLKSQGQFAIFSKQHVRPGKPWHSREGNYVKDLKTVIAEGEDLENAVLIEDQPSYVAHDQEPCISVLDCLYWKPTYTNAKDDGQGILPKNTVYYLLGLFKTYFENKDYAQMPLRKGIARIFPSTPAHYDYMHKVKPGPLFYANHLDGDNSQFIYDMICLGLDEVRKTDPEAILYAHKWLKMNLRDKPA